MYTYIYNIYTFICVSWLTDTCHLPHDAQYLCICMYTCKCIHIYMIYIHLSVWLDVLPSYGMPHDAQYLRIYMYTCTCINIYIMHIHLSVWLNSLPSYDMPHGSFICVYVRIHVNVYTYREYTYVNLCDMTHCHAMTCRMAHLSEWHDSWVNATWLMYYFTRVCSCRSMLVSVVQ